MDNSAYQELLDLQTELTERIGVLLHRQPFVLAIQTPSGYIDVLSMATSKEHVEELVKYALARVMDSDGVCSLHPQGCPDV